LCFFEHPRNKFPRVLKKAQLQEWEEFVKNYQSEMNAKRF
jgi:G:T/U-mismatch repair DNA glycosylase